MALSHSPKASYFSSLDPHAPRIAEGYNTTGGRQSPARQVAALIGFVALCFAAAGIGALLTNAALVDWYPALAKPTWNPPNRVFGPVWTVLYLMMAVSAWLVWRSGSWPAIRAALACFVGQLALNVGWSAIFFGLRSPGWAFVEILLLWLAIATTAFLFWRHSKTAALLLLPYLAWSSFAAVLNFTIWRLN